MDDIVRVVYPAVENNRHVGRVVLVRLHETPSHSYNIIKEDELSIEPADPSDNVIYPTFIETYIGMKPTFRTLRIFSVDKVHCISRTRCRA
jgi:hypothetical protein